MSNYMDDSFVVVGNTVVSYNGSNPIMKLPSSFNDLQVEEIGAAAFMESYKLQCVVLPPYVKSLGDFAFSKCNELTSAFISANITNVGTHVFRFSNNLRDITVYDLRLTASAYQNLKAMSYRSDDEVYVSREIPRIDLIQKLSLSQPDARPAVEVPGNISALFHLVDYDEIKGKFSIFKNIPVIGFDVPSVPVTENTAFSNYIKYQRPDVYDVMSEEKNDMHVRVGTMPPKNKTVIFTFDDKKTRIENGAYFINATLKFGYFFWQSAQKVVYEHKKYYIYRRYYLNSDSEMKYIRRDIDVYTDKGPVKNRTEAQNVYAKYKLLSIL